MAVRRARTSTPCAVSRRDDTRTATERDGDGEASSVSSSTKRAAVSAPLTGSGSCRGWSECGDRETGPIEDIWRRAFRPKLPRLRALLDAMRERLTVCGVR